MPEASIIATVTARASTPSWTARSLANQLAVTRGVVPESSTDHTHSTSSAKPLASHV